MSGWPEKTWDGLSVSREAPFGAAVHVWRRSVDGVEWLLLHRAHHGRDYEGDWAWTPPTGARLPGETVEACARRELLEEAGLALEPVPTPCGSPDWAVFVAELADDVPIELSAEHDAFAWFPADGAAPRCLPALVGRAVTCVADFLASEEQAQR